MMHFLLILLVATFQSLEADFIQQKSSAMFTEPQLSKGHLSYRQPDYLRWEYTSPASLVWQIDGKQSNLSPQIRQMVRLIMCSIDGSYLTENDDFYVSVSDNEAVLTPKRRQLSQLFSSITLQINPSTGIAKQVTIVERSGDTTHIAFSNVSTQ